MIQKLALVLLTLLLVNLLYSKFCNTRINTAKRYPLFIAIDSSDNVSNNAIVLLNGKEIGNLKEISSVGDKKLLSLNIYKDVEIPSDAFVSYFGNVTGGGYISFTHPEKSMVLNTIMPNDTINMGSLRNGGKLDSASAKVLVKIISDVINVVDSNLKKNKTVEQTEKSVKE